MSDALKQGDFRPSNLDKLAECPWFRSTPGGNENTSRGTTIDLAFRSRFLANPESSEPFCLAEEDRPAVEWAVEKARELAVGSTIITDKATCKVGIQFCRDPGEVDALVSERYMHIDVKSGQRHNYYLQQAAYAFGQMEVNTANHWTVFVLYCDLREVDHWTFHYDNVHELIWTARNDYEAQGEPRVNEYCSWCANFEQCPTQRQLASSALAVIEKEFRFDLTLSDSKKLGGFLDGCKTVREFEKRARDYVQEEMLEGRVGADGWKLTTRKGAEYVEMEKALEHLPADVIVRLINTIPRAQYELACKSAGVEPRQELIQQHGSSYYLRQTKPKKPKDSEQALRAGTEAD